MLNKIVNVKTLYDDENNLIYVVTKYNDNSYIVKIYKQSRSNYLNIKNRYIKTIKINHIVNI